MAFVEASMDEAYLFPCLVSFWGLLRAFKQKAPMERSSCSLNSESPHMKATNYLYPRLTTELQNDKFVGLCVTGSESPDWAISQKLCMSCGCQ